MLAIVELWVCPRFVFATLLVLVFYKQGEWRRVLGETMLL
jgi:hypothetical protein